MRTLLLKLLALYQRWISPQLGPACRFTPTCSEYAAEAITRHGVLGGVLLTLGRLLRCHPLGGRGLDMVPDEFGWRRGSRAKARAHVCEPGDGMKAGIS
jgi:putative membrane protein insertion efficiency factor